MNLQLNLWNIHDWLEEDGIEHFYTLEDDLPLLNGIRFQTPDVDKETYAVLYDVTDNNQYRSILSFQNGRIYFRFLSSAEAMNRLNERLSAYSDWTRQLVRKNLSHASLQELLDTAGSFFRFPLAVIRNAKVEAKTKNAESRDYSHIEKKLSEPDFISSLFQALLNASSSEGVLLLNSKNVGMLLLEHIPFRHHQAFLVAREADKKLTPGDLLLFSQISRAVKIHFQNREKEADGQYFFSANFGFTVLAEGAAPPEETTVQILKKMNWSYDDTFAVYCLQLQNLKISPYTDILYHLLKKAFPDSYILFRKDHIFLFFDTANTDCLPDETVFLSLLPSDLLFIGQSNLRSGFSHLPLLVSQAEQALEMARQTGKSFVNSQSISTQAVLKQFYADDSLQAMVHPAILRLNEMDKSGKAGFGYLNTLEVFLNSGTNLSAASRKLKLHRNTLINRIEKIKELTGLSLTDPEELEALLLSLIIYNRYSTESER